MIKLNLVIFFLLLEFQNPGQQVFGLDTNVLPWSAENDPMCRILRGIRNALLNQSLKKLSETEDLTCVIASQCTTITCTIGKEDADERFIVDFDLCRSNGSIIHVSLNSLLIRNFVWKLEIEPTDAIIHQRVEIPLKHEQGKSFFVNINFVRWFSPRNPTDGHWATLHLDVSLESCQHTNICDEPLPLLTGLAFPLQQLCSLPALYLESVPKYNYLTKSGNLIDKPKPQTTHIGMPCPLNNPFKCGINTMCRQRNGGKENEGVCACCSECEQVANGSCVLGVSTTTTIKPQIDADGSTPSLTGLGALLAILCVVLLSGGIFYGAKHNYFTRTKNRIRFFCTSWCTRRVLRVSNRENVFNTFDDEDDEPPLL